MGIYVIKISDMWSRTVVESLKKKKRNAFTLDTQRRASAWHELLTETSHLFCKSQENALKVGWR